MTGLGLDIGCSQVRTVARIGSLPRHGHRHRLWDEFACWLRRFSGQVRLLAVRESEAR